MSSAGTGDLSKTKKSLMLIGTAASNLFSRYTAKDGVQFSKSASNYQFYKW